MLKNGDAAMLTMNREKKECDEKKKDKKANSLRKTNEKQQIWH